MLKLTKAAAPEYATRGMPIDPLGPGDIDTPLRHAMSDEARAPLIAQHRLGRCGESGEVAKLVAWLGADQAAFATASYSYYPVDGAALSQQALFGQLAPARQLLLERQRRQCRRG